MRQIGFWELLGIFVGVAVIAWYVCMGGCKRKSCKTDEDDKSTSPHEK